MNKKTILFLFYTVTFVTNCSYSNSSIDGLPFIDVTKNYPEKEYILTDIADVTYIHLNTPNDEYLYKGGIIYVTENSIVVKDASSGSVLFFSKDGLPKSRFNHYGNGPEEYLGGFQVVYDEATDDVFVYGYSPFIQVYSSKGEYRRKLYLPHGVKPSQMDCFDNQSLIVYDISGIQYKAQPKDSKDNITPLIDSSFFLISKTDGQVLDYIEMSATQIDLSVKTPSGGVMLAFFTGIVRHADGFLLCNPETDTVFLYSKNKDLTPIICKIPSVGSLEPKIILNNCLDVDKYQFMEVQTISYDNIGYRDRHKHYIRDKKTGEVKLQKIVLPDYKGKEIIIIFCSPFVRPIIAGC